MSEVPCCANCFHGIRLIDGNIGCLEHAKWDDDAGTVSSPAMRPCELCSDWLDCNVALDDEGVDE